MGRISVQGWEPEHISHSTHSGYRMCGKQLYFGKVAQIEQRPSLAALGGNAVHHGIEKLSLLIWEHGIEALATPVAEVLDNHDDSEEPDYSEIPF